MCVCCLLFSDIPPDRAAQTAAPIVDKLDRYGFFITYRLYREATRVVDGKIIKVRIKNPFTMSDSRLSGSIVSEPRPGESRPA